MEKNHEFKTERRISNIMMGKGLKRFERQKIHYAFENLKLLRKVEDEILAHTNELTFKLNIEEYHEKMQWINEYMRAKGIEETIFTDIFDYETASADYDYYYELKTPTQYKIEEEIRKAKKLGIKPLTEGREPGDE